MKHITHLRAENFKGRNIDVDLEPLTLISGRNFTGKTAHMDAIVLAMLGHIPESGKKNDAIYELASGIRMAVQLTFSDGSTIQREFWRDGDSIRQAGPKETMNIPLLNKRAYFDMTDGERRHYIASRMELKGYNRDDILTELATRLGGMEKSNHRVNSEILNWTTTALDGPSIGECLKAFLDKKTGKLAAKYSEWYAIKSNSIGAVRTLAELRNREAECSAETLDSRRQAVQEAQTALEAALKHQGELAQAAMRANSDRARRDALQQKVSTAGPDPLPMPEAPKFVISIEAMKQDLEQKEKAHADGSDRLSVLPRLHDQLGKLRENLAYLSAEATELHKELEDTRNALEELAEETECPHCLSKSKGWKARREKLLKEECKAIQAKYDEKARQIVEGQKEMRELDFEISNEKEFQAARAELELELGSLRKRIDAHKRIIERYEQEVQRTKERNESAEREHAAGVRAAQEALAQLQIEQADESALQAAAQSVADAKAILSTAQAELEKALNLQQDLRRAVEAEERHAEACAYVDAITVAGKYLVECQERAIASVFVTLLDSANYYTDGILLTPLAYHDKEVGRFDKGRFIYHRTFSGAERDITHTAIACALSEKSSPRIVLLDEFGTMHTDVKQKVLDRLYCARRQGRIDQAIILDPEPSESLNLVEWLHIKL